MGLFLWIAACLAALGLGVYLGLPRVEGAPAWRRGTGALRTPSRAGGGAAGARAPKPDRGGADASATQEDLQASDQAREKTAARKKFLRRRVNPLDLLRLDERGSARRRTRRPFQMSPDEPAPPAPSDDPATAQRAVRRESRARQPSR